jgi:3-phosphoshikimate 1-carboxyvinyltransferase
LLVGEPGQWVLTGDSSLSKRPMNRVVGPLSRLGADISCADGIMPMEIMGKDPIAGLPETDEPIPVRSAQVHSSLLLAGLRSQHGVRLKRDTPMRDHSLRLARDLGWPIETLGQIDGVPPGPFDAHSDDRPLEYIVPGDLSSAAFLVAAALLLHGSEITVEGVGLNPTRTGFLKAARQMGGSVKWRVTDERWEPAGIIHVRSGPLNSGIDIGPETDPCTADCIDELPLIALLGVFANGETIVRGAGDLRTKESDRIGATVTMLQDLGADIEELADGFVVRGTGELSGGKWVDPRRDHRLTMMAAIAGLVARHAVSIPEPDSVATSWPDFWGVIDTLTGGRSVR